MCKVDGKKATFETKELGKMALAMFGATLLACTTVAGLTVKYIDLRLAVHERQKDIHQSAAIKNLLYVPRSEFEAYQEIHDEMELLKFKRRDDNGETE
jgi:hypothetical protein